MANVKVFADRQTDRRTGQKLYAPDLSIRGHKKRQNAEKFNSLSPYVSSCDIANVSMR
jgi:hypothetical protein